MPDSKAPLSNEVKAEMERQYQAIEKSLREHVDQQVALARGEPLKTGGMASERGSGAAGKRPRARLGVTLAGTALLLLLVLPVLLVLWQGQQIRTLESEVQALKGSKAPAPTARGHWNAEWEKLLAAPQRLIPCVRGIAETAGLDASQVGPNTKKGFTERLEKLEKGAELSADDLEKIKKGCFEYAVARYLRQQSPADASVKVDLNRGDVPVARLPALLRDLGILTWEGKVPGVENPEVHAAVTVTFLQQAEKGAGPK